MPGDILLKGQSASDSIRILDQLAGSRRALRWMKGISTMAGLRIMGDEVDAKIKAAHAANQN